METSILDYVAQECMDLNEALASCAGAERKDLLENHIKSVWNSVTPVEDFKRNLEWVNVSEPVSLAFHCVDKVVVLDFWTYCCINCYHVLPDLEHLEKTYSVKDGLVVIGVHSAKFTNEKDSENIYHAVNRYNIKHPVVNDGDSSTWQTLGIHCWPTLLVLGPGSKPIFIFTGEGHRDALVECVGAALKYFDSRLSTAPLPVKFANYVKIQEEEETFLRYPSKVSINPWYRGRSDEPLLAIADTGRHRVVLTDSGGIVLKEVGGEPGYNDGSLKEAQFRSPQGLCWLSSSVLAVCDTDNHRIRAIHLDEGVVDTLAGTGAQAAHGDLGGKCLGLQPLSSPWDVVQFTTPDMDMSVRPPPPPPPPPVADAGNKEDKNEEDDEKVSKEEKSPLLRRVLLMACAGSHQLWALFLDTTIWWKYKKYTEGTCVCVAGSGAEAARNSAYPNTAAFAQPSGLALRTGTNAELFIADSESSSIRKLSLTTGQVSTVCGGDRNPLNLFAFGDVDEVGTEAKLQHPLGVAFCEATKTLYVADTYNHKIKKVDILTQKVSTLNPTMIETADPVKFKEPSGLALSHDGKYLYIADTNNHSIKLLNISKNVCQEFKVRSEKPFVEPTNIILYKSDLFLNRKRGNIIIYFNVSLDNNAEIKNVKFTPSAPQKWSVCIRDGKNRDVTHDDFEFLHSSHKGVKLPGRVEMKLKQRTDKTHYRLYMSFETSLCDTFACFTHNFTVRATILVRESVKMIESYKITCKVNPVNRTQITPIEKVDLV